MTGSIHIPNKRFPHFHEYMIRYGATIGDDMNQDGSTDGPAVKRPRARHTNLQVVLMPMPTDIRRRTPGPATLPAICYRPSDLSDAMWKIL